MGKDLRLGIDDPRTIGRWKTREDREKKQSALSLVTVRVTSEKGSLRHDTDAVHAPVTTAPCGLETKPQALTIRWLACRPIFPGKANLFSGATRRMFVDPFQSPVYGFLNINHLIFTDRLPLPLSHIPTPLSPAKVNDPKAGCRS